MSDEALEPGALTGEPTPIQPEPLLRSRPNVPSLTGLRIFAALLVYLSHVGAWAGAPAIVATFFSSGYVGVTIFFILSGFVLSLNYAEELQKPRVGTIWTYAVARVARIYPLYLLVLVFVVVNTATATGGAAQVTEHALALQAWDPRVTTVFALNGPAWSVSVEFFLYACFPFLVVAFARLRSDRVIILTAALLLGGLFAITAWFAATGRGSLPWADAGSAHRWLYVLPASRLFDFSLGMLAASLFVRYRRHPRVVRAGPALAVSGAALIVALMSWSALFATAWSWDFAYVAPALMLMFGLAMAPRGLLARALSVPVIVLFGEASYAFYLVHVVLLGYLGARSWNLTFTKLSVIRELLTLGFVLCMAVGLHVLVEKPARSTIRVWGTYPSRLRDRVVARRGARTLAPTTAEEVVAATRSSSDGANGSGRTRRPSAARHGRRPVQGS